MIASVNASAPIATRQLHAARRQRGSTAAQNSVTAGLRENESDNAPRDLGIDRRFCRSGRRQREWPASQCRCTVSRTHAAASLQLITASTDAVVTTCKPCPQNPAFPLLYFLLFLPLFLPSRLRIKHPSASFQRSALNRHRKSMEYLSRAWCHANG